ncbi:MAG: hypothetical protein B7Z75_14435 [Acidocella sp. 20-57-95]|uniref:hypothetical protein n=1 Tax=Acidiphilium sp. TaxID=527 RepID=UPI000BC77E5C|nr:hypothetical protein [Acidiphilium sp.]OYV42038.1 MAG: hypothetical protein B7Z75_14435 [Acidocella sp. 20-57-95]HQT62776.1 hypothetical protein [Acidiphilium sp.]
MATVTVNGGNLFALAARYLGDATQWIRIAQLNGLTDPVLNVDTVPASSPVLTFVGAVPVFTLALPPVDPSATGGVPAQ